MDTVGFRSAIRISRIPLTTLCACIIILGTAAVGNTMPPHQDLQPNMASGKIEAPYFIQHKEEMYAAGVNSGQARPDGMPEHFAKPSVSGNFNILTLLVDFSDNTASVIAADFDTLVHVGLNGSVNNYYRENSYDNLSIVSPVYPSSLGWFRAPQTYSYYVNGQNGLGSYPHNSQRLVEDLVDLADPYVNFAQFDNNGDTYVHGLIVAHAGPGAEFTGSNNDIWSHKWAISPRIKDGVVITTYSMNPEYWLTPGDWSIMASGSWYDPLGSSPSDFDAWSGIFLGFMPLTVPQFDRTNVNVPRVETNPTIYKLWTGGSPASEYFLVENRQQVGYDSYIPSSGMLVWHIDENRSNNNNEWWPSGGQSQHYKVALEQADGLWEMEKNIDNGDAGDPFPGSTVSRALSASSTPSSDSYAGTGTMVSVVNISNSGATMTVDMAVGTPQEIVADEILLPGEIRLLGNVSNPFNPETILKFEAATEAEIRLEIFNLSGQRIRVLAD